jgi:hypothetical protein
MAMGGLIASFIKNSQLRDSNGFSIINYNLAITIVPSIITGTIIG